MSGRWGGSGQKGRRARGRGEDPGWIDALTREVVRADRGLGAGGNGGRGGSGDSILFSLRLPAQDRECGGGPPARRVAARPAAEVRAAETPVRTQGTSLEASHRSGPQCLNRERLAEQALPRLSWLNFISRASLRRSGGVTQTRACLVRPESSTPMQTFYSVSAALSAERRSQRLSE